MSVISCLKLPTGDLRPADDDARAIVKRWKVGDVVEVEAKRPRSQAFHRRFFGLIRMVWENSEFASERWPRLELFREELTKAAGYFEETVSMNGTKQFRAKSISFANMDEDEFSDLYSRVKHLILTKIPEWEGTDPDDLEAMLDEYTSMGAV